MDRMNWLPTAMFLVTFGTAAAVAAFRIHSLELQLEQQRTALELRIVTREPAPEPAPAPLIFVDCPQVEIEPYDDEPFTAIPVEEILEQAKERRRKLARAKAQAR